MVFLVMFKFIGLVDSGVVLYVIMEDLELIKKDFSLLMVDFHLLMEDFYLLRVSN
jgi:hypothetical protein